MSNSYRYPVVLLLLLGIQTLGCSGCQQASTKRNADNKELQQLGNQFMEFYRARSKTPADEAELKEFVVANMTDVKRQLLGITDTNKLFVSGRDGKPFIVRYGMTMTAGGPPPADGEAAINGAVIIYEAEGKGGYRQVVSSMGDMTELKFDELVKLVPDAK